MPEVKPDSAQTSALLLRVGQGDAQALERLLKRHRPQLHDFIELHLDRRLRSRLDPSDVVQETQMELVRRMDDYLHKRPMPFHLWQRKKAYERMFNLRRDHLGRARRSVSREVAMPDRSSLLLARPLLTSSPSQRLQTRELAERLGRAVEALSEPDREVLLLRHAEDLSFDEIAALLDIESATARKRFGRALIRLQKALTDAGLLESGQ